MADDSDGEWEESLVVMELNGIIDNDWIVKAGDQCKIVGMDSETPLLQLDRYIFSGEYKDTIGTNVLFQVNPNDPDAPTKSIDDRKTLTGQTSQLNYHSHTFKRLCMTRAFLAEKEEEKKTSVRIGSTSSTDVGQATPSAEGHVAMETESTHSGGPSSSVNQPPEGATEAATRQHTPPKGSKAFADPRSRVEKYCCCPLPAKWRTTQSVRYTLQQRYRAYAKGEIR